MIGYKVFVKDENGLYCDPNYREYKYKEGETYKIEEDSKLYKKWFCFYKKLKNIFEYYPLIPEIMIHKVEILGNIIDEDEEEGKRSYTDKLKVLEQVEFSKLLPSFLDTIKSIE